MGVECDPLVLRRDFAGGEVEAVDIGCPAGATSGLKIPQGGHAHSPRGRIHQQL
jgi:hypothetical protein